MALITEELMKWAGPLIILIDMPFLFLNTANNSSVKSKPTIIPVSVLQGHLLTGDKDQQL